MLQPHLLEVTLQRWLGGRRKEGDPIAIALPTSHGDLVRSEIEALDPESSAFEETEARTVKQNADQPDRATQGEQHGAHLLPRQDDRQAVRPGRPDEVVEPWQIHAKDPTVEEQQRRQRLVLRRCADSALDGESGQEPRHLGGANLGGVTLPVKQNVAPYPAKVGVLSPTAVMADP